MTPTRDRIYENTGDRLVDRSDEVLAAVPARYGLNLAVLDFNGDDRLDVYVGNDSQPNFLLRNDGDWQFKDVGVTSGSATNLEGDPQATMGIAVHSIIRTLPEMTRDHGISKAVYLPLFPQPR